MKLGIGELGDEEVCEAAGVDAGAGAVFEAGEDGFACGVAAVLADVDEG